MTDEHNERWTKLTSLSELIRDAIESPSISFFDTEWATMPRWYVLLLSKLRVLVKPEDVVFLSAESDAEGAATGSLFALTASQVVRAVRPTDSGQPIVSVWSRRNLSQISIFDVTPFALPDRPPRGYSRESSKIAIELRYLNDDPIAVPFEGASQVCIDALFAILPSLQDDIARIPER